MFHCLAVLMTQRFLSLNQSASLLIQFVFYLSSLHHTLLWGACSCLLDKLPVSAEELLPNLPKGLASPSCVRALSSGLISARYREDNPFLGSTGLFLSAQLRVLGPSWLLEHTVGLCLACWEPGSSSFPAQLLTARHSSLCVLPQGCSIPHVGSCSRPCWISEVSSWLKPPACLKSLWMNASLLTGYPQFRHTTKLETWRGGQAEIF